MSESLELEFSQREMIVKALLECECLRRGRDWVASQLPLEIQRQLTLNLRHDQSLFDLLESCLRLSDRDGIGKLLDILRNQEGENSRNFYNVCAALHEARFLCRTKLPPGELGGLKTQLESLTHLESRLDRIINATLLGGPRWDPLGVLAPHTAFLQLFLIGRQYGVGFLQRLGREEDCAAQARRLRGWMEEHAEALGVSLEQLHSIGAEVEREASQPVCILLKIEENRMEDGHYLMQAWGWRGEEEGAIPIELDAKLEEAPRFRKGHPVATLDVAVRDAIRAAKDQYDTEDVVVELFVERKFFGQAIGGWKIHLGQNTLRSLMKAHPVFLRWLDRYGLRRRDHRAWEKKWKRVKAVSERDPRHALEWSVARDSHTPEEIADGWAADDRGLCLALGYAPPPPRRDGDADLLDAVRDRGTPILCWVNPVNDGEDVAKETFESMLQDSRLADLPTHFLKLRQTDHGNDPAHPVHRLVLLFDDADRKLPAPVGTARG